jgi:uncharacterized protein (TIGR03435 family)
MLHRAPAIFQDVAGSRSIQFGEVVRASDSAGGTLLLADTSRVEMRSKAEFSIERAPDGIQIHLRKGSLIVNAAKQHGHLYVQTKDVTVSVVGTVFLVNAEEEGSRVAVIEGEVHVKQGATETKLGPGEQMTTNPNMESLSVKEELAWSRQAVTHVASMEQARASAPPLPKEEPLAFEVASIRPSGSPTGGGGRGGGEEPCAASSLKIDPQRFSVSKATLYNLVTLAYGLGGSAGGNGTRCSNASAMNILSGGPNWKSDQFDIQALIPDGSADFTSRTVGGVSVQEPGPRLQRMLQTLLADRFKLSLRHEFKEMPVYVLGVAKGGPILTAWKDGDSVSLGSYSYATPVRNRTSLASVLSGSKASMAELAARLEAVTNRPVLDRTSLAGDFNYRVEFAPPPDFTGYPSLFPGVPVMTSPSLITALKEQLGLELKPDKASVEVLVIDRAEKPEN